MKHIHLGNIDANLDTADWLKNTDDLAASGVDVVAFLKANPDLPIARRITKGFGDPGSTQERLPNGTFGSASSMTTSELRAHLGSHLGLSNTRKLGMRPRLESMHDIYHGSMAAVNNYNQGGFHTHDATKGFGDPGSTQSQDAHGRFTVGSGAPRDAANLKYPELHARDMTAGGTNSPLMTRAEFQASAARGEDIVNNAIANGSPPVNLMTGPNIQAAVDAAQQEWGGVTIDAHGGGVVSQASQPPDPLSVSMRDEGQGSVIVSAAAVAADPGALMAAMQQAQTQFADQLSAQSAALGMFRDMESGTVQFDPVLVVQGVSTARDVGAYTQATGGAFRMSDGNGYWPGHVAG
jgi:hypothetical protein